MSFTDHSVVVVTPVFEDVEASTRLFCELAAQFGDQLFVVAVDDGSSGSPSFLTASSGLVLPV